MPERRPMEDFTKARAKTDPNSVVYAREVEGGGWELRDEEGRDLGVCPPDIVKELFEIERENAAE